jgi:stage V sporulation protein SpoVS
MIGDNLVTVVTTAGVDLITSPSFMTIERIVLELWQENALNPIWRDFGEIGGILATFVTAAGVVLITSPSFMTIERNVAGKCTKFYLARIWRDWRQFGDHCDHRGGGLDNFPKFHDNRTNSLGVYTGQTDIHTYIL